MIDVPQPTFSSLMRIAMSDGSLTALSIVINIEERSVLNEY